jgi:tetratricopeptide (TPR) repeat protein
VEGQARTHLFVSYAGADRPWAEWAATQLEAVGLSVELDVWDWTTGENVVLKMSGALEHADLVLALWSPAYFELHRYTQDEWTAVLADRPGEHARMIPVRVSEVTPPAVLRPLLYRDLFGLDENAARRELLAAVQGPSGRGKQAPFPGSDVLRVAGYRVPGSLPRVWNVTSRNRIFTGRKSLLAQLRRRLTHNQRASVQALHGIAGVGKSQLAIEYAHLFAGDYRLVWWVDAEQPALIGEQLAMLAVTARWAPADVDTHSGVQVVHERLRSSDGWLIIFDNALSGETLRPWLPQGPGHVITTSRSNDFAGLGEPLDIDLFTRAESCALLRARRPDLSQGAHQVAEALGDLPLALAQAAGLMAKTGMTVAEYLSELSAHATDLLSQPSGGYPGSLAAATRLAVDKLEETNPASAQLLRLCAWLAPEPIPLTWLANDRMPEPLAGIIGRPLAFRGALGDLAESGLARVSSDSVELHRLTQAILRNRISSTDEEPGYWANQAVILLLDAARAEPEDPASWTTWARLTPHILATTGYEEELGVESDNTIALLNRAAIYLWRRSQMEPAGTVALRAERIARTVHRSDDYPVVAQVLRTHAWILKDSDKLEDARNLFQEVLRIDKGSAPGKTVSDDLFALAWVLKDLGLPKEARLHFLDALEARSDEQDRQAAQIHLSLGWLAKSVGDLQEAGYRFEKALHVDSEAATHPDRKTADIHVALGWLAQDLGKIEDAQHYFDIASRIRRDTPVGGPDRALASTFRAMGYQALRLGQEEEARARAEADQVEAKVPLAEKNAHLQFMTALGHFKEALSIDSAAAQGAPDRTVLHDELGLGWASLKLGRLSEARDCFDHVCSKARDDDVEYALLGLGWVDKAERRLRDAEQHLQRCLVLSERGGPSSHAVIRTRWALACVLHARNEEGAARDVLEQAYMASRQHFGGTHPVTCMLAEASRRWSSSSSSLEPSIVIW